MTQHDSPRPPRFCPNCGAHNLALAPTCTVCGQALGKKEDFAKLWGAQSTATDPDGTEVIDLYPTYDAASQATTPFTQTRPFDPADYRASSTGKAGKKSGAAPISPTLSGSGASAPPPVIAAPLVATRKGPPGCVLGCLALVLIAVLAGFVGWHIVRSAVSDRVADEVSVGVSNELQRIDDLQVDTSGQIVLTEQEINDSLKENADLYTPVENVEVVILASGITVTFDLYGVSSTFKGGLDVNDGQIVVTDPRLTGPAKQIIDADEIASVFETETQTLLTRFDLKPKDVLLKKGTVIVSTTSSPATPSVLRTVESD